MLEWNVYYASWNGNCIKTMNIFEGGSFVEDLKKDAKKLHIREDRPDEKKWFLERLRRNIQYYFWSKCEWEIVMTSWPSGKKGFKDEKIDVYDQVMMNWHVFSEYVWQNRKELKKK